MDRSPTTHSDAHAAATRLAALRENPSGGPRLLFFSGGSALRALSRELKLLTHNSTHLITPFDSGGSSAQLRRAFGMPSVGDLRNRMIALADETMQGNPAIFRLFAHRLSNEANQAALVAELQTLAAGEHPLILALPGALQARCIDQCQSFVAAMPEDFDLRGASIGNLLLTGAWLQEGTELHSAVQEMSRQLRVLGAVCPVSVADQHLAARLADGSQVLGQHRITGKECAPLDQPIRDLSLVQGLDDPRPARCEASPAALQAIATAELVCLPMGSFWTSLCANLLPQGIGRAIATAAAPRCYIPNAGQDPEEQGLQIHEALTVLHRLICDDLGEARPLHSLIDLILLDEDPSTYGDRLDPAALRSLGVELRQTKLRRPAGPPRFDPRRLAEFLAAM